MTLTKFLLGFRDFYSKDEIIDFIRRSKNFDASAESPSRSRALLIFSTSKQHSWLVASEARLYCILDDVRKPEPHINWSIPKPRLVADGEVALEVKPHPYTANTGRVDFGDDHKGWLYSRVLFTNVPIDRAVHGLIRDAMLSQDQALAS